MYNDVHTSSNIGEKSKIRKKIGRWFHGWRPKRPKDEMKEYVCVCVYVCRGMTNLERGRERGRKRRQRGKEGDTASLPFSSNFPFLLGRTLFFPPSVFNFVSLSTRSRAEKEGGGFLAAARERARSRHVLIVARYRVPVNRRDSFRPSRNSII